MKIIPLEELDEFSKEYHTSVDVSKRTRSQSLQTQNHWTWKSFAIKPTHSMVMDSSSPLKGIKSVEFNPTELCNRTCHFCPRVDPTVYPNRKLFMQEETVINVINELIKYNYTGQIMFSGMGEPLLNRNICNLIKICSEAGFFTEMTTNGDKIYNESWYSMQDFVDAGLSAIHVDIYDDTEQYLDWIDIALPYRDKINFRITPRFVLATGVFNNRAGDVKHGAIITDIPDDEWFSPSVKAFIDWDGTVQLCCHDWQRVGGNFGNVNTTPFTEIWNGDKMSTIRKQLQTNSRRKLGSPCNNCTTGGNLHDKKKGLGIK